VKVSSNLDNNLFYRQFLSLINKSGFEEESKLKSSIFSSIESWLTRTPNPVYDPLNVWDDIVTSRVMFVDAYSKHIKGFKEELAEKNHLADIKSLIYLQAANGAKEMALYDSSEKYLRKAVDEWINIHSWTSLIVDLKIRQYRTKYLNEDLDFNVARLKKIEEVIKHQRDANGDQKDVLSHTFRLALLLGDIKQMVMEVVMHNFKENTIQGDDKNYFSEAMDKTYKIYQKVIAKSESWEIKEEIATEAHMKFALFIDNILSTDSPIIEQALAEKELDKGQLSMLLVKSGFAALNRSASSSSSLIPRILQALAKYPEQCQEAFKKGAEQTPSWKFLGWKSQILAWINEPISDVIFKTVAKLCAEYLEAMFYAFKVVESDLVLRLVSVKESKLYKGLQKRCNSVDSNLNHFVESLDCLVDPEYRWKYFFDLIRESMLREDQASKAKAARIAGLLIENVTREERKYIGRRIGLNNREFARTYGQKVRDAFGDDGKELLNMTYNEFVTAITDVFYEVNDK